MFLILIGIAMSLSDNSWCFKNFGYDDIKILLILIAIGTLDMLNTMAIYIFLIKS